MKIKVSDLQGAALDYAVSMAEGFTKNSGASLVIMMTYSPSTNWDQGGPIIERDGINIRAIRKPGHPQDGRWLAAFDHGNTGTMVQWVKREDWHKHYFVGDTALIAAMRCYVASELGMNVEIPDAILN